MNVEWTYNTPGPVASAFFRSNAFVRGIRGPIGSGKTTACIMEIWRRANQQEPVLLPADEGGVRRKGKRMTRWAIIRNTYPELNTTTIKSWHQWFPPNVGNWKSTGPPTHIIKAGDVEMEVMFVALDRPEDVRKLLSMELTGAYLNEAREIPKAILDGLTGRVGRFPAMRDGGPTWSGIIMDTNPPDMEHWWYELAEKDRPEGFAFFAQPGGRDAKAENLTNLLPDYYDRSCMGKKPEWIKIYVNGDYGYIVDGKAIYDSFRDNLHVMDVRYNSQALLHIGMDFGLTPAAVFAQRNVMGQCRVISEIVATRLGAKNFAKEIKNHLSERYPGATMGTITGDPAGDQAAQTDEETVYQMLASEGVIALPASTNDIAIRIEAVNSKLALLVDGEPALVISPDCKALRKACAGGYHYRRVQMASELRYEEKPYKNMSSHVAEALQYLQLGLGGGREVIRRPEGLNRQRPDLPQSSYTDWDYFRSR